MEAHSLVFTNFPGIELIQAAWNQIYPRGWIHTVGKGILLYTYIGFGLSLFHLHGILLYTLYTLLNLALEYLGNPSKSAGIVLIILFTDYNNALKCVQCNLLNHYCEELFAPSQQWVFEYMSLHLGIMLVLWFLSMLGGNFCIRPQLHLQGVTQKSHTPSPSLPKGIKSKLSLETIPNWPRVIHLHHREGEDSSGTLVTLGSEMLTMRTEPLANSQWTCCVGKK